MMIISATFNHQLQLNLRNVKAEPVIEEDWSFLDATEPIKDGSGDAASGVIQDDIDDAAVEDVPMTVNDDIIPLTGDIYIILGTLSLLLPVK